MAGIIAWDRGRVHDGKIRDGILWGRQIATQAESLMLSMRQAGDKNPLESAVRALSIGQEPRVMRVTTAQESLGQATEISSFDRSSGVLEYLKVFSPETGQGIRVKLQLGFTGFLGSTTRVGSDVAIVVYFAIIGAFFQLLALALARKAGTPSVSRPTDDRELRARVREWAENFKGALTQMGAHIRDLVKVAHDMAVVSARSRAQVEELRGKLHAGIREIRDARGAAKSSEQEATQAEVAVLNLVLEAARAGEAGARAAEGAQELHRLVQSFRKLNQEAFGRLGAVEIAIEPWATDADLACLAFEGMAQATGAIDGPIRKTTEALLGQAKLIQGLNREAEPPPPTPVKVPEAAVAGSTEGASDARVDPLEESLARKRALRQARLNEDDGPPLKASSIVPARKR